MMDNDLIDLLAACRGAELDPVRCEQLLERLRRDDAFRQSAVAEVRMLGMLKAVQSTEPRWLLLQEALGSDSATRTTEENLEKEFLRRVQGIRRRRWAVPWGWWAAAVLVAGLTVLLLRTRGHREVPVAAQPSPSSLIGHANARDKLALVVKLDGVRWEAEDGTPPAEGDVVGARALRLRSGLATLAFFSGVTLTLEGPADLDLIARDQIFCRRGRLRAEVPKGSEGFVVTSTRTAVLDRGTEFGLNVEADGRARIMVFEGMAEVALLDASGVTKRTQLVERSESFDVDPFIDRIAEAVARPDLFVSRMAPAASSLALDPAYPRAVLAARPRGYWRFQTMEGGAVPNEVPGGQPLRVTGPVAIARGPRGDGHAVFQAGASEQCLYTDGLWELPRTPGHAVEFWFSAEVYRGASLLGLYPPVEWVRPGESFKYAHCVLLETIGRAYHSLHKPASVRFLHRLSNAKAGDNAYSEEVYLPRRWHHVVAQKVGDRMVLYFDGAPGHPLQLVPDHPDVSCRLVVGRRAPAPEELNEPRPFVGRMDELAFYDHPLSAEEVRHHFQLATTGAAPKVARADQPGD